MQLYPHGWRLLDALGQPVLAADLHGRVVYWNHAAELLYGHTAQEALGRLVSEVGLGRDERAAEMATAVSAGGSWTGEVRVENRDGRIFDALVTCSPVLDGADAVVGVVVVSADITDRVAAEQLMLERERQVAERVGFIAAASNLLAGSLDPQMTLATAAQIPVPLLADWCAIHLLDGLGNLQLAAVWHEDPGQCAQLRAYYEQFPPLLHDLHGSGAVARTGRSEVMSDVTSQDLADLAGMPDQLDALVGLEIRSLLVVPLTARDRTIGALALVRASGGAYDAAERGLAEDLANRAGLAVDNARLYQERVDVAESLLRTLLPPDLPAIDGIDLAAFYRAAGDGEVGGDFYDVFPAGDGRWGVVVGDVSGKGPTAAALTGVARTAVRLLGGQGRPVREVLGELNRVILEQAEEGQFATVASLVLEPWTSGVEVTMCMAGHPPPMVRRADGRVEQVGAAGTLLGIVSAPLLAESETHLGSGDVLVLYTDGVTERTSAGLMLGEEGLRALLADTVGMSALEVAAAIEQAVVDFDIAPPRDDLAGVVLRVR